MAAFSPHPLPDHLNCLLSDKARSDGLDVLLSHMLLACRVIGTNLRNAGYSADKTGTDNAFGDHQLDVDVKTDAVMFECLTKSEVVHVAASEENPIEIDCACKRNGGGESGFSVGFDPLDGSSIFDANFAVGTIAGIWPGKGLLNRRGCEQAASFVTMYGPKVTMALAIAARCTLSGEAISLELTMGPEVWFVSKPRLTIAPKAKTFAPGNLRATADNTGYNALVNYWIQNKYTLRYSGGLVPDVYHILIKGEGVLSNASSPSAKAKLRLLFEAAPIALIVVKYLVFSPTLFVPFFFHTPRLLTIKKNHSLIPPLFFFACT